MTLGGRQSKKARKEGIPLGSRAGVVVDSGQPTVGLQLRAVEDDGDIIEGRERGRVLVTIDIDNGGDNINAGGVGQYNLKVGHVVAGVAYTSLVVSETTTE